MDTPKLWFESNQLTADVTHKLSLPICCQRSSLSPAAATLTREPELLEHVTGYKIGKFPDVLPFYTGYAE